MESIKGPVKTGTGYIPGKSDRDNTDKSNSDAPKSRQP